MSLVVDHNNKLKEIKESKDCWITACSSRMSLDNHIIRFNEKQRHGRWFYAETRKPTKGSNIYTQWLRREIAIHSIAINNHSIENQFNQLAAKWRKETGGYSTSYHITKNSRYVDIIGMGMPVVPLILKDLQKEPDYWFTALHHIVKPDVDPIAKEHYGDLEKMAEDWIKWGRDNKYI